MREPVRVLHPITRMIVGGAQLNTLYTCDRIDKKRFRADLLTGPQLGSEGDLLSSAKKKVPTFVIPELRREINPFWDLRAYRSIQSHLRRHPYTIVHTHTSKAGILARKAARAHRVPVVIHTAHGWQWTQARGGIMNRFIMASERWAARFSDRIIVVAEQDREKGLAAGVGTPDQYVMIESAIPLEDFDPARVHGKAFRETRGIPLDAPVAGTVGRFAYQKAPEVMLQAARLLLDRDPAAHFVYVGDGPLRESLLDVFPDLNDHPRMHLVGLHTQVAPVVAAFDVFLLSSRYEGLPRVVIEAMAMGKPVVSTPADGVTDVVEEGITGLIVPHNDPAALAAGAKTLLDSPQSGDMGRRGQKMVRHRFGLDRMVERIQALYEEVLAEKNLN